MMNNTNNNANETNHSEVSSTSYCADVESSQHERNPAHGSKQQDFVPIRGYNDDSDHMDHDDDDDADHDHEECYSCQGNVLESQEIMPNTPLQNHETINYYEPQQGNDDGEEGYVSSSEKTPILSNHANSSLHEYLSMNSSLSMEELCLLNDYKQNDNNDINNGTKMVLDGNRTKCGGDLNCPPSKHPMHPLGNKQPKKTRGTGTGTRTSTATTTTATTSGRVRKYIPKLMRRTKSISEKVLDHKGRRQPTLCRDTAFAILYLAQLIVVICAGLRFGPDASGEDGNHDNSFHKTVVSIDEFGMPVKETSVDSVQGIEFDYKNTLLVTLATGVASMGLSLAVMSFMAVFTKHLVHMALFLAICLSIVWTIVGLIRTDQSFVPLTGVFALGASIVYTFMVWEKIPFVYANLFTALEAIRNTLAIVVLAIVMQIVALIWIIFYFFTIIGTYDYFQRDDGDHQLKSWNVAAYVGLGISFYWTIQSLSHIIQVCIAGYIQRWWFSSRLDRSEKLDVIGESLIRALVYSLGSVCFGSLFIGFVNFLRSIADHIRPNTEEAPLRALVAVQEFIVSCIDYVALIFHNFAMVYVGMYGYDYLQAADRANILFFKRGWQDIVEHSLLSNLLWVISLVIAGLCGCISMEIEHVWKFSLVSVDEPITLSFCIGFFVGFILSNILFSVIRSSVNTVVVCFAGSPTEFQTFHPECSQIMRKAWKESWPGFVDFVEKDNVVLGPRSPSRRNLRRNLHI